ncbi:MAG: response regulator, partial [Candidatus Omnitrophica bacterium]|nr:response regulator [Candidatus Omnitrophota bacterium]
MKIKYKLTIGFVIIAFLVLFGGILSFARQERNLINAIGNDFSILAKETILNLDRSIYQSVENLQVFMTDIVWQEEIERSNQEFEKQKDIQEIIDEREKQWRAAANEDIAPFMESLLENDLSEELMEIIEFYNEKYTYKIYGEILITNKYGVNVGMTNKTTDYLQSDELWWQEAKKNGIYVSDVVYDESAGVQAVEICLKIESEHKEFIGVIKAVLNVEHFFTILRQMENNGTEFYHHPVEFKLLTKDFKYLYSTDNYHLGENAEESLIQNIYKNPYQVNYWIDKGDEEDENEEFFAFAQSRGYKEYKGLGWILVIEIAKDHVWGPINRLQHFVLFLNGIILLGIFMAGLFIYRAITIPLNRISKGVTEIGTGNLNVSVDIFANDEIGFLAKSFNEMATGLKQKTTSIERLNIEIDQRRRMEEQAKLSAVKLNEAHVATLKVMEDLRKQKEIADKHRSEAEAAAKAKGHFLANMSHEIRTPMNAILGFAQLLRKTELNDQQDKYLRTISTSGQLLIGIINDILDVSKLESGKIELECQDFDMLNVINEVFKMVGARMKDSFLDTYVDIAEDVPRFVKGDSIRLRQVLVNLLGNAVKFTVKGEIGVLVTVENKFSDKDAVELKFVIKDSGIGISEEKKRKIFEPFTQADESTTRKYGGTGLGLTISKAIIEAMGGRIWVESKEGKGSEFIFTIKLKKSFKEEYSELYEHAKKVLKNMKVFIVDDNEVARSINQKHCQDLGLKLLAINANVHGALRKLDELAEENCLPDFIISDIYMPGSDGYEFVEKIRKNKKFDAVKMVALTADVQATPKRGKDKYGFETVVAKPVMKHDLADALVQVLGQGKKKEI